LVGRHQRWFVLACAFVRLAKYSSRLSATFPSVRVRVKEKVRARAKAQSRMLLTLASFRSHPKHFPLSLTPQM